MWPYKIIFTNGLLLSTRITSGSFKKCTHGLHVTLHNNICNWINCNLTSLPPPIQYFKLALISPNVHISYLRILGNKLGRIQSYFTPPIEIQRCRYDTSNPPLWLSRHHCLRYNMVASDTQVGKRYYLPHSTRCVPLFTRGDFPEGVLDLRCNSLRPN